MHELSIAQALVTQIKNAADNAGGGTVISAHIIVGGLSGVDAEALEMAFPIAIEGTILGGTKLNIEKAPALIHCNNCGKETTPDFPFPVCMACDSVDVTISGGRDLLLESIQLN